MTGPLSLDAFLGSLRDATLRASEDVQPWHGFWHHRPTRQFPPASVREPEQWTPSDRLALVCTQTDLKPAAQKKLVQRWCALLPTLSGVRYLWLGSKVLPEMFEAVCAMPALEGLHIKWSSITDFSGIRRLRSLRQHHVGSSPSAAPLEPLAGLPHLEWLELCNVRALANLDFLERLPHLRGLRLTGDTNSNKVFTTATLGPLRALTQLEWLSLAAFVSADGALEPLEHLPRLRWLLLSNRFPMEAVAALAARMPQVDCELFRPRGDPVTWMRCKACGEQSMVMLTGKGTPMLCLRCDAARVQRHAEAFAAAMERARSPA